MEKKRLGNIGHATTPTELPLPYQSASTEIIIQLDAGMAGRVIWGGIVMNVCVV
jgi:hypothetical protein